MSQDPSRLPLRIAERAGRLLFWVMQHSELTRAERELACWFITDGDGEYLDTITSIPTIAKQLGCSANTVGKAMLGLREKGLVENEKRTTPGGQPTSDRNRLVVPPDLARLRSSVKSPTDELDVADYKIGTSRFGVPNTRMESRTPESGGASTPEFGYEPSSIPEEKDLEREEGSTADSGVPPFQLGRRPSRSAPRSPRSFAAIVGSAGTA